MMLCFEWNTQTQLSTFVKSYAEENIFSFKLGMLMNTLKRIALTFEEVLAVHC
mgnify:CR=1 FL=1